MLRLFVIFGLCAAVAAALPSLYQRKAGEIAAWLKQGQPALPERLSLDGQAASGKRVTIRADARGHFTDRFRLNGREVEALVDTGATLVAINLSTARRVGLSLSPADFTQRVETANGIVKVAVATLDRVQVGPISVTNVPVAVLEDEALSGTLVGMSFLSRLSRFQAASGALLMVQ